MELLLLPLLLVGALIATMDSTDSDGLEAQDSEDVADPQVSNSVGGLIDLIESNGDSDLKVSALDEAEIEGALNPSAGEGDLEDRSTIYGGPKENLIVLGKGSFRAMDGDDCFLSEMEGIATVKGSDGADNFIISRLPNDSYDGVHESAQQMIIENFDSDVDKIGLILDSDYVGDLTVSSRWNAELKLNDVRVVQNLQESEPASVLIARFQLIGVENFELEDIEFFIGEDCVPVTFDLNGSVRDDTISGGHPSGTSVAMGYGGDDQIVIRAGQAFGGAGSDLITGGDVGLGVGKFFGDGGDDTLSGVGQLFGGTGNDSIELSALSMNPGYEWQEYIISGYVNGGDGDDTITAGAQSVDSEHGEKVKVEGGVHVDAGAGDDLITFSQSLGVDAGAGDDAVVIEATWDARQGSHPFVVLGSGSDSIYLKPVSSCLGTCTIIDDFDPLEDKLGLIVAEATSNSIKFTQVFDSSNNSSRVEFDAGTGETDKISSFTLLGVNCELHPVSVHLFSDVDAALADRSYRVV